MIQFILGIIIGAISLGLIIFPKLKASIQLDEETINKNIETSNTNQELLGYQQQIQTNIDSLNDEKEDILKDISVLKTLKTDTQQDIDTLKDLAKKNSEDFLNTEMALAEEKFDRAMEQLGSEYEKNKSDYEELYFQELKECTAEFVEIINNKRLELNKLNNTVEEYRKKIQSVIEAQKRREEENNKKNFYSVCISNEDKEEISKLREVGKYLRDKDLLNKIIWKGYYEKPTSLMCGRVVGPDKKCGIYKITNQENLMSYIGQSNDIEARFKQHIKRGLGAETPTRNKLYPAMYSIGIENFTFEIIEECKPDILNKQEKYWIEFYETQSYGYNVTKGGA